MSVAPRGRGWREPLLAWALAATPRLTVFLAQWPNVRLDAASADFPGGHLASDLATPLWPPLYEALAQVLWRLAGAHPFLYGLELIAVHALVGVAVLWLARALSLTTRATWLAVVAVALLPYYVAASVRQVDVGVVVSVSALCVAIVARWRARGESGWGGVGITAFAALTWFLARAESGAAMVLVFGVALWRPGALARRCVFAAVAGFAVLLLAWSGVNAYRFGHFTPFPAHGGFNLSVGNHAGVADELWRRDFNPTLLVVPGGNTVTDVSDPYAVDAATSRAAWSYITGHPAAFLRALAPKSYRYWDPQLDDQTPHSTAEQLAYTAPYLLYLLLAVLGVTVLWRRGAVWAAGLLLAVILGYWAPHLLLYGLIRHRMTVEWALLVLAAVGADALLPHYATAYSLRRDD